MTSDARLRNSYLVFVLGGLIGAGCLGSRLMTLNVGFASEARLRNRYLVFVSSGLIAAGCPGRRLMTL